eukprot:CAMPEP_0197333886 /NCGR_PEP_ID=MMETSP0892-20130614/27152_1 /TAXON_ID=44058 ORGANISM="Aureoumbra lagunensis, Strain CCMP1510" /NCGR_SAMPLE_ID=MMETSP0892 /ASSEMBLY_ACC=CAM_ASM_000538 /LENGTH=45 /DNA_ID= /DNA_START= /DNA_END= /DNA_ORIENTATION=
MTKAMMRMIRLMLRLSLNNSPSNIEELSTVSSQKGAVVKKQKRNK